ncbi:CaiB/BaiF CoA-transferase family protein [Arthrobacter sp. ISL-30]|uniref:CaiB/BaiF CoA transferase family protein n=1 Tax=Arthrobacter sp. ISL-30 TaxID=2819109 RepID=UPI001BEB14F6|nr:CoA transferase [Arthrobacter sp. ISL-30]MBT2513485.1 CoA transferase [Arthrobacter sp. ISL-30]
MTQTPIAPLDGVRVLELGNYIAAPTAGRLLADFGAEVIKVERPGTGDELRNWRLYKGDTSMLYRTINRNKKSVVLDLRTEAGRQAVLELAAKSDILLENFRPGTLEKWGLGPEVLNEANPELIITRVSAFGQTGPLSARPGFAAVAEAYGGFRNLVGDPDRPPVRVGVSIGDSIAGLYAAFGSMMSLYQREARRRAAGAASQVTSAESQLTGAQVTEIPLTERVIDVALNEAMFSMMESLIPDYEAYGVERQRTGGRMEGIAPSNAYFCKDGSSIVVAGNGDSIFQRYMETIGRPDLGADPALQSNAGRWERREELDQAIGEWTGKLSAAEALAALDAAGVPAGPIYTAADICEDSQYRARNMVQRFDVSMGQETITDVGFPGIVPVIGGQSLPIRNLGPDLGADTQDILGGLLNLDAGQIAAASGQAVSDKVREEALQA